MTAGLSISRRSLKVLSATMDFLHNPRHPSKPIRLIGNNECWYSLYLKFLSYPSHKLWQLPLLDCQAQLVHKRFLVLPRVFLKSSHVSFYKTEKILNDITWLWYFNLTTTKEKWKVSIIFSVPVPHEEDDVWKLRSIWADRAHCLCGNPVYLLMGLYSYQE